MILLRIGKLAPKKRNSYNQYIMKNFLENMKNREPLFPSKESLLSPFRQEFTKTFIEIYRHSSKDSHLLGSASKPTRCGTPLCKILLCTNFTPCKQGSIKWTRETRWAWVNPICLEQIKCYIMDLTDPV